MQIVIEIPKSEIPKYQDIIEIPLHFIDGKVCEAGGYGFDVLPKGHGRIMDVDKIIKKMEEREEQLKDNRSMYETSCVETALDIFGETIIEADKER